MRRRLRKTWRLPWMLDELLVIVCFDAREDEKRRALPVSFIGHDIDAWLREPGTRHALLDMYETACPGRQAAGGWGADKIVKDALVDAFDRGFLVAIKRERPRYLATPPRQEEAPAPRPPAATRRFSLEVVDDASEAAVAEIPFTITLPDAQKPEKTTNAAGRIDVSCREGGFASVASKIDGATLAESAVLVGVSPSRIGVGMSDGADGAPAKKAKHLVRLFTHRIGAGDALDTIAEQHGLSRDALTRFNWQTTAPREIKKHLAHVGCAYRDEGGRIVFTSAGTPGVIYIPAAVELTGLALDAVHVVRTRPAFIRRFDFSC